MSPFRVVIPARFASTRLPGKPLADIAGLPMVLRVVEVARQSGASFVGVATDHPEVECICQRAGCVVWMTDEAHPSGTDRLAEVALREGWDDEDIVVNLQGDEPLMSPVLVAQVAQLLALDRQASIATAAHPIVSVEEFLNPNVVKVVLDQAQRALYFSRAPVPWPRDGFAISRAALPAGIPALRHIGLYSYRVGFLKAYTKISPSPLEAFEALEQLRALGAGYSIAVREILDAPPAGVDTPEDLERVRAVFSDFKN